MKLSQFCFENNLNSHPEMWCISSVDLACLIIISIKSCTNSSNSTRVKLSMVLNKSSMPHMITKMFHTPTLRLINCLPASTLPVWSTSKCWQAIVDYIAIQSSIVISSSSSSLLLEELELEPRITRHHKHAGPANQYNVVHLPTVSTLWTPKIIPFQSKQSKHFHQKHQFI
jgi:hypothetical protein